MGNAPKIGRIRAGGWKGGNKPDSGAAGLLQHQVKAADQWAYQTDNRTFPGQTQGALCRHSTVTLLKVCRPFLQGGSIMAEPECLIEAALHLADFAFDLAAKAWSADLAVTYKADGSSLTQADLSIEAHWREQIRRQFPSHGILGEEYGSDSGSSAFTWVLDPIDGTRQFGTGLLNFASLISLCRDGVPVLGIIDLPMPGARYVAAEGKGTMFAGRAVRSSAHLDIAEAVISLANPDSFRGASAAGYQNLRSTGRVRVFDGGAAAYGALARGLVDVCLNGDDLGAYDICALCPVVQEAGGMITDWDGQPLSLTSSGAIIASASPALHTKALNYLRLPV